MTGEDSTVSIHLPPSGRSEGCAVVVTGDDGRSTTIAYGVRFAWAVKVAYRVREHLDNGEGLRGLALDLENGEQS